MKRNKPINQMVIIIAAFVILIGGVLFFFLNDSAYKMTDDGFQVIAGVKKNFEKGTSFVYKENGISYKGATDHEYISSTPLYFQNEKNKIVVAQESVYVKGETAWMRKTASFSEFLLKDTLTYNGDKISGGFLFDGKNTYIFLEKMNVKINGKVIVLPAFSTIEVSGKDIYFYYNIGNDEIGLDYIYTDSLTAQCDNYKVDLMNDILYTKRNEKVLLYTRPDLLDELK